MTEESKTPKHEREGNYYIPTTVLFLRLFFKRKKTHKPYM